MPLNCTLLKQLILLCEFYLNKKKGREEGKKREREGAREGGGEEGKKGLRARSMGGCGLLSFPMLS